MVTRCIFDGRSTKAEIVVKVFHFTCNYRLTHEPEIPICGLVAELGERYIRTGKHSACKLFTNNFSLESGNPVSQCPCYAGARHSITVFNQYRGIAPIFVAVCDEQQLRSLVAVKRRVCCCCTGDRGGDLSAHRRVRRVGVDGRKVIHGPRVRRSLAERAGQGKPQCASLRSRRAGSQEQDRRIPAGGRRNLGHGTVVFELCRISLNAVASWLIEHGLTSHQTHYRSYRRPFLQVLWPNKQCQSTKGN